MSRSSTEACSHPTCRGPRGTFSASVYFQVALNAASSPVDVVSSPIPFDLVLVNVGGGVFDTTLHRYVAPVGGPYRFDYAVTLTDTGTGSVANGQVAVYAEVGSLETPASVQRFELVTSFSDEEETRTLSGSAIVELLEGQTLRLTSVNTSGNTSSSVAGPATPSTPPYPTLLSGFSLF